MKPIMRRCIHALPSLVMNMWIIHTMVRSMLLSSFPQLSMYTTCTFRVKIFLKVWCAKKKILIVACGERRGQTLNAVSGDRNWPGIMIMLNNGGSGSQRFMKCDGSDTFHAGRHDWFYCTSTKCAIPDDIAFHAFYASFSSFLCLFLASKFLSVGNISHLGRLSNQSKWGVYVDYVMSHPATVISDGSRVQMYVQHA